MDIFASPFWSRSMTAGGGDGDLRADTTVATPPPTTAPTAKQATCIKDALDMAEPEGRVCAFNFYHGPQVTA